MTQPIEIFVDLDGVLADYSGEYLRLFDHNPDDDKKLADSRDKKKAKHAKINNFKTKPHFYRHLPLIHDAMKLWNFLTPYHPSILSAASNFAPASRQDKYEWVKEHLHLSGPKVIVVDYPNQKWKHCTGKHCILIDDNTKNCSEWINAGGTAILHKSAAKTIEQLKPMLAHMHVEETLMTLKPVANVVECFDQLKELETEGDSEFDQHTRHLPVGTVMSAKTGNGMFSEKHHTIVKGAKNWHRINNHMQQGQTHTGTAEDTPFDTHKITGATHMLPGIAKGERVANVLHMEALPDKSVIQTKEHSVGDQKLPAANYEKRGKDWHHLENPNSEPLQSHHFSASLEARPHHWIK